MDFQERWYYLQRRRLESIEEDRSVAAWIAVLHGLLISLQLRVIQMRRRSEPSVSVRNPRITLHFGDIYYHIQVSTACFQSQRNRSLLQAVCYLSGITGKPFKYVLSRSMDGFLLERQERSGTLPFLLSIHGANYFLAVRTSGEHTPE